MTAESVPTQPALPGPADPVKTLPEAAANACARLTAREARDVAAAVLYVLSDLMAVDPSSAWPDSDDLALIADAIEDGGM